MLVSEHLFSLLELGKMLLHLFRLLEVQILHDYQFSRGFVL